MRRYPARQEYGIRQEYGRRLKLNHKMDTVLTRPVGGTKQITANAVFFVGLDSREKISATTTKTEAGKEDKTIKRIFAFLTAMA